MTEHPLGPGLHDPPVAPQVALGPPAQLATPPPVQMLPPAAWYPNPTGPGQRYWDGAQWTQNYAQDASVASVHQPLANRCHAPPHEGGHRFWASAAGS